MESLGEVIPFLSHERPDVRQMAIESIAGICLDEHVVAQFATHPEYLSALVKRFEDQPLIAMNAWKTLINLSKDQRICANLYDHIERVVQEIQSSTTAFGDFASMLLANVSQNDGCQLAICGHLGHLLEIYLKGRAYNPKASYDFLGNVFAQVTTCKEGRQFFTANKFENMYRILSQVQSSQLMRRGSAVSIIKNCLFEVEDHTTLFRCDDEEDRLLAHLTGLLASPSSVFDDEEIEEMILDVQLEYRHTAAEDDPSIRALIMESFILLGSTRLGRDKLREKKIYPVLREWHKQEPEEVLKELLEKVVDLLIRDEE